MNTNNNFFNNIEVVNGFQHHNGFYGLKKIPKKVDIELDKVIDELKKDNSNFESTNEMLAGHIEQEYRLPNIPITEEFVKQAVIEIENETRYGFNYIESKVSTSISNIFRDSKWEWFINEDAWVNLQYKHEFNPNHIHSGLYSWVIWYDIPYSYEDEAKLGPGRNKRYKEQINGSFVFSVADWKSSGVIDHVIHVDKKFNKTFIIFPSTLNHSVYPFYTSDKPRITIAGNVHMRLAEDPTIYNERNIKRI